MLIYKAKVRPLPLYGDFIIIWWIFQAFPCLLCHCSKAFDRFHDGIGGFGAFKLNETVWDEENGEYGDRDLEELGGKEGYLTRRSCG